MVVDTGTTTFCYHPLRATTILDPTHTHTLSSQYTHPPPRDAARRTPALGLSLDATRTGLVSEKPGITRTLFHQSQELGGV